MSLRARAWAFTVRDVPPLAKLAMIVLAEACVPDATRQGDLPRFRCPRPSPLWETLAERACMTPRELDEQLTELLRRGLVTVDGDDVILNGFVATTTAVSNDHAEASR